MQERNLCSQGKITLVKSLLTPVYISSGNKFMSAWNNLNGVDCEQSLFCLKIYEQARYVSIGAAKPRASSCAGAKFIYSHIQLKYNNNKEKKEEVKNRANYTLN